MKKTHLLVAILACFQLVFAAQQAAAAPWQNDDIEESIEEIGEQIEEALEALSESWGESADRLGEHFEQWAEEHAEELERWADEYAEDWEAWAEGLEQKMERFADEQEQVWNQWAERYEKNWQRWSEELESKEVDSDIVGELIERNLEMLSEMPLGQLVDGLLEEGLGEFSEAPWESLEELGKLAESAFQEPLAELAEEGIQKREAVNQEIRKLKNALKAIEVQQEEEALDNTSETERRAASEAALVKRDQIRAQIRALSNLLERDNLTEAQRNKLEQAIATLADAESMLAAENDESSKLREKLELRSRNPRGDREATIRERIKAEELRHAETLRAFNEDLRRTSEQARRAESRARQLEARKPKRVDGANLDPESKQRRDHSAARRDRTGKARSAEAETDLPRPAKSEIQMLREEIQQLRQEIRELKENSARQ